MEFEEIDLRELFDIIRKRFVLIVIIVVLSVMTASVLSFFVLDKEYEASTSLIVGNSKSYSSSEDALEYNEVMMYQKLIKTFSEIAKSRMISEKVIDTLNLEYTVDSLRNKISITSVGDTQMINIQVRDNDPKLAASIANEIATIFQHEVATIMKVENIEVIDAARVPTSPIKPKPFLNIAIALALSLMIGIGICFLLEYFDQTIKTPSDVEKYLELPVIGAIPDTTHVN